MWNHLRLNATIVSHALRHVVWSFEGRHSGQYPYYVDDKDEKGEFMLKQAVAEAPQFFTRNFKNADSPLMDCTDERKDNEGH